VNAREITGLVLIVVGLVLIPVAWTTSRLLWLIAFLTFVVGGILFFSERLRRRIERSEPEASHCSTSPSRAVPTDIHNYTGWRSGGRSETMDAAEGPDGE
jgi:uncharacterized protein (DUF58 family)